MFCTLRTGRHNNISDLSLRRSYYHRRSIGFSLIPVRDEDEEQR